MTDVGCERAHRRTGRGRILRSGLRRAAIALALLCVTPRAHAAEPSIEAAIEANRPSIEA
jgi:hypothetical protein